MIFVTKVLIAISNFVTSNLCFGYILNGRLLIRGYGGVYKYNVYP